jgi:hypothetical protein
MSVSVKSQPKQFWKYVPDVKRIYNTFIQNNVDEQLVTEHKNIADAFANHIKSVFNPSVPSVTLPFSVTTDFLLTAPSLTLKSAGL